MLCFLNLKKERLEAMVFGKVLGSLQENICDGVQLS